jgi:tripeptide aminopeptidase
MNQYAFTVTERFLRYVQIDTQSNPDSTENPSTGKQLVLSELLAKELQQMGASQVHTDAFGYVYAKIPATVQHAVPTVAFCSHIDTAPDCSGTNVKPLVHRNYNGDTINLPLENQSISPQKYPYLLQHVGGTIITASGDTLLGADDKAGVAIIMDFAHYLLTHPHLPHGEVSIVFTPDEEVGRGTEKIDLNRVGASYAYTLDGGEAGSFEDETFSANMATLTIHGIIAHPGQGKGNLVNAIKLVAEVLELLPKKELTPETTEGREGFIHPTHISGLAEAATVSFLLRDFDTKALATYKEMIEKAAQTVTNLYPGTSYTVTVQEQYRNMREIIDLHPQIVNFAKTAYQKLQLPFIHTPIRGGTDGSKLSWMGLPTANLFTGMQAIHSRHEWVAVKDMELSVQMLVQLIQEWAAAN